MLASRVQPRPALRWALLCGNNDYGCVLPIDLPGLFWGSSQRPLVPIRRGRRGGWIPPLQALPPRYLAGQLGMVWHLGGGLYALKLISQGALNQGNLEQLAERVGIGSRHLRRLFHRHLGASPLAIARSHRVQVARSLIVETDLPVRQIASCTGFASIRQFNHSVKTTFGDSPRSLRRLRRASQPGDPRAGIVVHLPYRAPFDWPCLIRFLGSRLTPGVEAVEGGCYRRTIEVAGVIGAIEVSDEPSESRLAMRVILPRYDRLMEVVQRATRLFDLGADALHIERHLSREEHLRAWSRNGPA